MYQRIAYLLNTYSNIILSIKIFDRNMPRKLKFAEFSLIQVKWVLQGWGVLTY